MFSIRSLTHNDRTQWDQLWQGYLTFYESAVPADVTDLTGSRLMDPEAPILGFCAATPDGKLLGFVHYLFHPVTWAAGPRCYLEDLFTSPDARGQGVGRALIEAVYAAAHEMARSVDDVLSRRTRARLLARDASAAAADDVAALIAPILGLSEAEAQAQAQAYRTAVAAERTTAELPETAFALGGA